jgi:hypothetical protein
MAEPVRYRNKGTQSDPRMLLHQTEIQDAGMLMLVASTSIPMLVASTSMPDAQLCLLVRKRNVRTLLELTTFSNYIEANGKVC